MQEISNEHELEQQKSELDISYADIANKLLADRLLLTALELHCELTEAGKELPKLKEYFSNPGNFEQQSTRVELSASGLTRWSSQTTLDSLDMTRYSEDGEKIVDDRVAVLEFELRKAKETINALRTNLTVATECETPMQDISSSSKVYVLEPIKPHEQRALNFLINEYLLLHGYKLTSITFADENENQDFEVWDDVGLNIPKPPELLHLYRESMKSSHILNTTYNTSSTQTDSDIEEIELLISQLDMHKNRISELENENKELDANIEKMKPDRLETVATHFAASISDTNSLPDHFIMVESCQVFSSDTTEDVQGTGTSEITRSAEYSEKSKLVEIIDESESDESTSQNNDWLKLNECSSETKIENVNDVLSMLSNKCDRHLPVAFQNEIFARCYIDAGLIPGAILLKQMENENALVRFVHIIGGTLNKISSNISPNKREDLILLITLAIHHHPVSNVREKLMQLLFNLRKKPKDDERKTILSSVIWLARNSKISLIENELLPLCWEALNYKYVERRLLVSELCCTVTPYLSNTARNSLLLSILQQMLLEDKEDRVKTSAINSITFIVTFMDDENKYAQCEELLFTGLQDSSPIVVETTTLTLLPVLSKWAFDLEKLHSHLIFRLIRVLETQIKSAASQRKDESSSPFKHTLLWETRCVWTLNAIRSILPFIVMYVASSQIVLQSIHPNLPTALPRSGFSEVCCGLCNPSTFYEGKYSLGEIIRAFDVIVVEETWQQLDWLVKVLIPLLLDILGHVIIRQENLIGGFLSLFHSITSGFGRAAINTKIKPIFVERLKTIELKLANVSEDLPNLSMLPIYILAVLVPLQENDDLQNILNRLLFMLPISGCSTAVLEYCVKELSQINYTQEILLSTLWEGVVHTREVIRLTVVKLFSLVIPNVSDFTLINRIIPAIVTLSNDPDSVVSAATIKVLGTLIKETSIKEVMDKCCFQLQTMLSEQNLFENHSSLVQLISTLGQIASHCDSVFREDVLVPQLAASAAFTSQLTNQSRRQELFRELMDAYSAVIYCSFTKSTISTALIPGLRCLETICTDSVAHRETISSMIKEVESRTGSRETVNNPSISSVTANVSQEMKQRMSKIFQTPISKQTKFWKK